MTRAELLHHAIKVYGEESQILMVFEEMSELQKEICKRARGKDNAVLIAEEIADVRIMLDQLEIICDLDGLIDCVEDAKLKRLAERLGVRYGE